MATSRPLECYTPPPNDGRAILRPRGFVGQRDNDVPLYEYVVRHTHARKFWGLPTIALDNPIIRCIQSSASTVPQLAALLSRRRVPVPYAVDEAARLKRHDFLQLLVLHAGYSPLGVALEYEPLVDVLPAAKGASAQADAAAVHAACELASQLMARAPSECDLDNLVAYVRRMHDDNPDAPQFDDVREAICARAYALRAMHMRADTYAHCERLFECDLACGASAASPDVFEFATTVRRVFTQLPPELREYVFSFVGGPGRGEFVYCEDTVHKWMQARIVATRANCALVAYLGWSCKWSEWIALPSDRLRPWIATARFDAVRSSDDGRLHAQPLGEARERLCLVSPDDTSRLDYCHRAIMLLCARWLAEPTWPPHVHRALSLWLSAAVRSELEACDFLGEPLPIAWIRQAHTRPEWAPLRAAIAGATDLANGSATLVHAVDAALSAMARPAFVRVPRFSTSMLTWLVRR